MVHRPVERYCVPRILVTNLSSKRPHIQLNSSDRDTVWGFWCHFLLWRHKPLNFYRRIWPFCDIFLIISTPWLSADIFSLPRVNFHSTFVTKYDVYTKGRMQLHIWLTQLNPVMNMPAAKHWLLRCNSTEQFVISQNTLHRFYWGRPTWFQWFH